MNGTKHILNALALAVIANIGVVSAAQAQQNTKSLGLSEAITTTLANNSNIQLSKLDGSIAMANYRQTEAIFLPQALITLN